MDFEWSLWYVFVLETQPLSPVCLFLKLKKKKKKKKNEEEEEEVNIQNFLRECYVYYNLLYSPLKVYPGFWVDCSVPSFYLKPHLLSFVFISQKKKKEKKKRVVELTPNTFIARSVCKPFIVNG